jgi:hypothetical protein
MAAAPASSAAVAAASGQAVNLAPHRLGTLQTAATAEAAPLRAACKLLNDSSIAEAHFNALVAEIFKQITVGADDSAFARIAGSALFARVADGRAAVAPALAAFNAHIADWARCHTPAAAVRSALEENGLSAERAGAASEAYGASVDAVRQLLSAQGTFIIAGASVSERATCVRFPRALAFAVRGLHSRSTSIPLRAMKPLRAGIAMPQLLDLSWRLDYAVSSREAGKVSKPVFRVRMDVLEPALVPGCAPVPRSHEFVCAPQELEDLRSRVKAAVRAAQCIARDAGGGAAPARP